VRAIGGDVQELRTSLMFISCLKFIRSVI